MPRMVFLLLFSTLLYSSCIQSPPSTDLADRIISPLTSYETLINNRKISNREDAASEDDKSLINLDYPIEIWLYKHNKYYFELPNLGSGIGDWTYRDGRLILENDYHIKTIDLKIKMEYSLYLNSSGDARIQFTDRFGIQNLPLDKITE